MGALRQEFWTASWPLNTTLGIPFVSARIALIIGITGQDGAYLARLLLRNGYFVHGTSRNAGTAELNGLIALRIADRMKYDRCRPAHVPVLTK
jgi:GDP-mannose 4,6 dehydratase